MSQKMGFFVRKCEATGKHVHAVMPLVDLATTLLVKDGRVLAVYNAKWGAFTLPMSKRRRWEAPAGTKETEREEEWTDTAVRAAAEWLGRTLTGEPEFLAEVAEFQQSDRDAQWKRYRMRVYKIEVDTLDLPAGKACEWLLPDELTDEDRRPISPTARHVIGELKLNGLV